jgi:hypothetical protein
MSCCARRCFVFLARPSGDFAPAGDLLSGPPESRQRAAPAKPPLRGSLRCSEPGAAPNSLRYAPFKQRGAKSGVEACCARAPGSCASRRFRRGAPEQPNNQQPNPKAGGRRLFLHSPFEPAEERKALRPRAQRASTSDFAQLSERSVAKRVLREASRLEYRRAARCEAKGRAVRGRLFAFFLVAQKEGRPPGRRPGMGLATKPKQPKQPKRSA